MGFCFQRSLYNLKIKVLTDTLCLYIEQAKDKKKKKKKPFGIFYTLSFWEKESIQAKALSYVYMIRIFISLTLSLSDPI